MNRILRRITEYLTDANIDINERLGVFFVNVGIVAAYFGVLICLLAHEPIIGTISTALIAVTAPLIAGITRHTGHREWYGSIVGVMVIIMIPIVWLTTGGTTGGTGFWFLYELFYIMLFARPKQMLPFCIAAIVVQAAAITAFIRFPDLFFHFSDQSYALVSKIGSGIVVTAEIMVTVYVQKTLYVHEQAISTKSQDTTRNFVASIANTIDTKDPYTGGHSRRVAECASAIALRLGMSQAEADNMYFVALLHDIGKIGVPDLVLNKPGRLTDEEFAQIRRHPVYGASILKDVTTIPHVQDGVLYHHEHYDGTGYPEGLKGEEIPYIARVISVADSYDAMSTTRVYRKHMSHEEIIRELIRCRGTQFDPHIDDVFVQMLNEGFRLESDTNEDEDILDSSLAASSAEMISRITEVDQPAKQRIGATIVNNVTFACMYDYLCGLSRRYGDEMMVINISLTSEKPIQDNGRIENCMASLNQIITQNIRSSDICTCSGTTSFLILLLNVPDANAQQILERIETDFYQMQGNKDVILSHSIIEINNAAEQNKV